MHPRARGGSRERSKKTRDLLCPIEGPALGKAIKGVAATSPVATPASPPAAPSKAKTAAAVAGGGGGGGSSSSSQRRRESLLGVRRLGGLAYGLVVLTTVALSQGSTDREYLVDFFDALDGSNWADNTGWTDDSVALDDWAGITATVDGNGTECVMFLELPSNDLVGTIPDVGEGQLECLKRLKLGDNMITGGIPGLSKLQGLLVLDLERNGLTGEIPAELGNLPVLLNFFLGENALFGTIPPELGNLGNLEELSLESNAFDGIIPTELGNLETLQHLDLSGNSLIGLIPGTFGNLLSLRSLYLQDNDLAGTIPEELGTLVVDGDLGEVDLKNNFLTGDIPDGLKELYPDSLYLAGNLMVCCEPRADDDTETAPPYPTPAPMKPLPTLAPLLPTPAPSTKAPTQTPTPTLAPTTPAAEAPTQTPTPTLAPTTPAPPKPADLPDPGDTDGGRGGIDGGTIAGIVIGTVVVVAALGCLGFCCCRRRRGTRRGRKKLARGPEPTKTTTGTTLLIGAGYISGNRHPSADPSALFGPVALDCPTHSSVGSSGPPEAGAESPSRPVAQAPPPLPPRDVAPESPREKSSDSGGGRSSGFSTNASSPFHSAYSAHNNNNSGTFNSTGKTEPSFQPLAPFVSAHHSGFEVDAAPAIDSELDVQLGSPRRDDGPNDSPAVCTNGDGSCYRDPAASAALAAATAAVAAGGGQTGGKVGASSVKQDRSQSTGGGGTRRRRTITEDTRSKSEGVPHSRQPDPQSPPSAYGLTGNLTSLPADPGADEEPSWYTGPLGTPAEMIPPERVGGGSGDSSDQPYRRASSLFGSGSGRKLDAVLAVAKRLSSAAQSSSVAGVPEVGMLVESLVTLSADNKSNAAAFATSLNLCENLKKVLDQAESLLQKDPGSEAGRKLLEGVQVEVKNVVDVMEAYKRKKRWKQIWEASIYRRRVEEAEEAVNKMLGFVQMALHGQSLAEARALGESMARLEQSLQQDLASRRKKREQELIREEAIPADDIEIHSELVIGSGGAGEVYMADYAGVNAAAKVVKIGGEGHKAEKQLKSFLTEVRNMRRLNKSPRVVRIYGIVTISPSERVLVMEYMSGGDLFSFIKRHRDEGLPRFSDELARSLVNDVAQGLAYLHKHDTWHGDLKSLNILLDAKNRAKISDFGTSHWTKETASKCFSSRAPDTSLNQFSFHWAAPEILEHGSPSVQLRNASHSSGLSLSEREEMHQRVVSQSFMSDVYSFGIVVWEVLSREVPWEDLEGKEMDRRVRIVGDRPTMPASAPPDLAKLAGACWCEKPESRLTCDQILAHLGGVRALS